MVPRRSSARSVRMSFPQRPRCRSRWTRPSSSFTGSASTGSTSTPRSSRGLARPPRAGPERQHRRARRPADVHRLVPGQAGPLRRQAVRRPREGPQLRGCASPCSPGRCPSHPNTSRQCPRRAPRYSRASTFVDQVAELLNPTGGGVQRPRAGRLFAEATRSMESEVQGLGCVAEQTAGLVTLALACRERERVSCRVRAQAAPRGGDGVRSPALARRIEWPLWPTVFMQLDL